MPSSFVFLTDCASSASVGRYGVYLDPAKRLVYTRGGEGQPLEIVQGLHLDLGWVSACTVGESLRSWLEDREAQLDRIVSGFSEKVDRGWSTSSVRGDWTRAALIVADDLRESLQQALRDQLIASYWKVTEWWACLRPHELVEKVLADRSLDAFVGAESQRARVANVWIDYDEALDHLKEVLRHRRQRLEAALTALDQPTWGAASHEHYRIDRALDDGHPPDPDWDAGGQDATVTLQREIISAIRSVDVDSVTRARMTIRSMDADHPLDPSTLFAALSAATVDPTIWAALTQIRQAVVLSEDR